MEHLNVLLRIFFVSGVFQKIIPPSLFHFRFTETNFKTAEIVEITRKLCRKTHFRIRKSSTKFHFKVRKFHFKLRKALFRTSLERNGINKNVLEFDVEKDGGYIFLIFILFNKDYNFEISCVELYLNKKAYKHKCLITSFPISYANVILIKLNIYLIYIMYRASKNIYFRITFFSKLTENIL